VFNRHDRWHFTAATVIKVCWACAAVFNFFRVPNPGLWGVTGIYIGLAAIIFIVAGWPEPPPIPDEETE
jgi:hypothetical protein